MGGEQYNKQPTDLAEVHGQLSEVRCVLVCVTDALAELQDPGDAEAEPIDVEDERVTVKQAILMLDEAMDAFDRHYP